MFINVAKINKSGGHLQFSDQFLHAHEYLNFLYFEKFFGWKGLKYQHVLVDVSKKFVI